MAAFDQVRLQTERLLLRPLCEADACALFSIFSDPRVMCYWSTPAWESLAEAREKIAADAKAMAAAQYLELGIERLEDGQLIGRCALFNLIAQCKRAELGFASTCP
jgi:RimJ/RimL family protein N-acetyltransferase